MATGDELIAEVAALLRDPSMRQWTRPRLISAMAAAYQALCKAKPDAYTVCRDLQLVEGTEQRVPDSAHGIAEIMHNVCPETGQAKRAVTLSDKAAFDAAHPQWRQDAVKGYIKQWMMSDGDEHKWHNWPPIGPVTLSTDDLTDCGTEPVDPGPTVIPTTSPVTFDPGELTGTASLTDGNLNSFSGGGTSGSGGALVTANARNRSTGKYFWQGLLVDANGNNENRNQLGIINGLFTDPGFQSYSVVDSDERRVLQNGAAITPRTGPEFIRGTIVNQRLDLDAGTWEISVGDLTSWETIATGLTGTWFPYVFGSRSAAGLIGSRLGLRFAAADLTVPVPDGYLTWDQVQGATQADADQYQVDLAAYTTCRSANGVIAGCTEPTDPGPVSLDLQDPVTPVLLDPATNTGGVTLSNGDLTATNNSNTYESIAADSVAQLDSGKWIWKTIFDGVGNGEDVAVGLTNQPALPGAGVGYLGYNSNSIGFYNTGRVYDRGTLTQSLTALAAGTEVINKLDLDNGTYHVSIAGAGDIEIATGLTGTWFPAVSVSDRLSGLGQVTVGFLIADVGTIPDGFSTYGAVGGPDAVTQAQVDQYIVDLAAFDQCLLDYVPVESENVVVVRANLYETPVIDSGEIPAEPVEPTAPTAPVDPGPSNVPAGIQTFNAFYHSSGPAFAGDQIVLEFLPGDARPQTVFDAIVADGEQVLLNFVNGPEDWTHGNRTFNGIPHDVFPVGTFTPGVVIQTPSTSSHGIGPEGSPAGTYYDSINDIGTVWSGPVVMLANLNSGADRIDVEDVNFTAITQAEVDQYQADLAIYNTELAAYTVDLDAYNIALAEYNDALAGGNVGTQEIPFDNVYYAFLREYMLYYAYLVDDEMTPNHARGERHYAKAYESIGIRTQMQKAIKEIREVQE